METVHLAMRPDATEVLLQGDLSIAQTRATYQHLNEALVRGQPIFLDADKLERLDGAGAQLLLAFCRAARERGLVLEWRRVSPALDHIAQLLGLTELLGMTARMSHVPTA